RFHQPIRVRVPGAGPGQARGCRSAAALSTRWHGALRNPLHQPEERPMKQLVVTTHVVERREGIAIVSVLLVLAALMMLGVGSLVLTQSNLLTAENLTSNSIAKANAEAGVDATVAWLTAQFLATGEVPNSMQHAPTV